MKYTYLPYMTYSICTVVYRAVCYLQERVVCDNCKHKRLKLSTSTVIYSNVHHCTEVINISNSESYFPEYRTNAH